MRIQGLYVRRYRSILRSSMIDCGGLNVLIGKNNAGKSTFLSAISRLVSHFERGSLAGPLFVARNGRVVDDFTDRDLTRPFQIAIQFAMPARVNDALRARLKAEFPHLERSIEQLRDCTSLAALVAGCCVNSEKGYLYVQQLSAGRVNDSAEDLTLEGMSLLSIPPAVGAELYSFTMEARALDRDVKSIEDIFGRTDRVAFMFQRGGPPRDSLVEYVAPEASPELRVNLTTIARAAETEDQFRKRTAELQVSLKERIAAVQARQTSTPLSTFAGSANVAPEYARWLMAQCADMKFLQFQERKRPIGRDEATSLLRMKVTRGGPQKLEAVQETVRSLLGVQLDAFQAEGKSDDRAEMDIDDFLVDANGAGVREALRIVLDLELASPDLVLLEEPEVHLHPGLERAVEAYLRARSGDTQIFLTTHSTNFIDGLSFQNVYLISRDASKKTRCQLMGAEGSRRIPAELGLRLSTVFMFDRLVFVEGPTDEAVLRALASSLQLDLAQANVGFVQMGGVRNFANFAAEPTLDLLCRRNVQMWFMADRDERDDAEVTAMAEKLGDSAKLIVLKRRELENYLLDPSAVAAFVNKKLDSAKSTNPATTAEQAGAALKRSAASLREEVVRLRLERRALKPVFLQHRKQTGTPAERLARASAELKARLESLGEEEERVASELRACWPDRALELAPGCAVLDLTCQEFGVRFAKEAGDSIHLARLLGPLAVPEDLASLLREVCSPRSGTE